MNRARLVVPVVLATALIGLAAPAHAATETTHDVPAGQILPPVDFDASYFGVADTMAATPWAGPGTLALPYTNPLASGYYLSSIAIPAPPAGCSRMINGYQYTFDNAQENVEALSGLYSSALSRIEAINFLPDLSVPGQRTWTATLSPSIASTDLAFVYQGFVVYADRVLTLHDFAFNVTDTCAEPEPAGPGLAETGADSVLPSLAAAAVLLLLGLALLLRRRA